MKELSGIMVVGAFLMVASFSISACAAYAEGKLGLFFWLAVTNIFLWFVLGLFWIYSFYRFTNQWRDNDE